MGFITSKYWKSDHRKKSSLQHYCFSQPWHFSSINRGLYTHLGHFLVKEYRISKIQKFLSGSKKFTNDRMKLHNPSLQSCWISPFVLCWYLRNQRESFHLTFGLIISRLGKVLFKMFLYHEEQIFKTCF